VAKKRQESGQIVRSAASAQVSLGVGPNWTLRRFLLGFFRCQSAGISPNWWTQQIWITIWAKQERGKLLLGDLLIYWSIVLRACLPSTKLPTLPTLPLGCSYATPLSLGAQTGRSFG